MNLRYGLAALDSYFKEGDARQLRERADQRFDWEKQKAQSELSLLGDKTAADRSQYQNTVGANAAAAELRPGATANAKAKQGLDAVTISGDVKRQPGLEEAKDNEAIAAQGASKVKAALQGVQSDRIPEIVANAKMQGVIDDAASSKLISATVADLFDSGDQSGLVNLLNAQKKVSGDPKITALPDVASVAKAQDAQGNQVLVLKDASGNQIMARPMANYYAARDSLAKPEIKSVNAGDSLVRIKGGTATPLYTAPGNSAKDSRPAEVRLADYYVSKGVPEDEALRRASRLKDMSPANAEFQLYKDRIALSPNADEATKQKIRQEVRKEVEDIFKVSPTPQTNTASGASAQANPKVMAAAGLGAAPAAPAPSPQTAPSPSLSQAPTTATTTAPEEGAPLAQRLAQAIQADNAGGRGNFDRLAQEVARNAPQLQQQLAALKSALPNAAGSQRAFIQQKIAELEPEASLTQSILAQAKAARGY
jgi:hypothetical protein